VNLTRAGRQLERAGGEISREPLARREGGGGEISRVPGTLLEGVGADVIHAGAGEVGFLLRGRHRTWSAAEIHTPLAQLGEAFERLRNRGILLIEAQTMQQNTPAITMYTKLGFKQVDEGVMYRKES